MFNYLLWLWYRTKDPLVLTPFFVFYQLLGLQQHQVSFPFLHESIAGFLHDDWYCVFLQLEQSLIRPHLQLGNDVTNEERVHELFLTCNHAAVLATT